MPHSMQPLHVPIELCIICKLLSIDQWVMSTCFIILTYPMKRLFDNDSPKYM
jgi:hypothetical protein